MRWLIVFLGRLFRKDPKEQWVHDMLDRQRRADRG